MEYPVTSLTEYLFTCTKQYRENVAMIELDTERTVTYADLESLVIQASHGLQSVGIKPGDIVSIISSNNIDYAIAFLALASFGAVTQATNPLYTKEELKAQFEKCSTSYVITISSLLDKVRESVNNNIKKLIVIGDCKESSDTIPFEKVISLGKGKTELKPITFDPKTTPACYLFSSGTTGLPKAVMLSHFNIIANLTQLRCIELNEKESILVFLPFYHLYGLMAILCSSLTFGSKMMIMSRFMPVPYMEAIQKYKIDVIHAVPPVMVVLVKYPQTSSYDLTSVHKVICGAAPLGQAIENKVKDIFKIEYISQGYGMTECMVTHFDTVEDHREGSVGKVVNGVKTKISDLETRETLGPNCRGEVCIQGPQIMLGYLNQPDVTAEMIDEDGWLKTGDIGYQDEDGFLYIVDRIKELIKYKGNQVAPAELEALLLTHPGIADVGVVGVPDEEAGELPKAFVVLKKDVKLSAEEIQDFVQKQVSPHKKLRGGVEFIDTIPKSASGKILRRVLRDRK